MRTADHVLAMRIKEGSAGYGVYIMLLELLRDAESRSLVFNPANLAFAINEPDIDLVRRVCTEYGLFDMSEDNRLSSPWLEAQMTAYDDAKQAAREAGRRGAAKRYGKPVPAEGADNRVPIGSPCPPLSVPHSNITQYNKTNEINSTKSRLLGLTWGDMSGEDLFRLARGLRTDLDDITRQWAEGKQKELDHDRGAGKHNLGALLEVADHFGLSQEVFTWLLKFTNLGETGRPPMVRLMKVYHEAISTKFKPKYAAEYVICKLLEP